MNRTFYDTLMYERTHLETIAKKLRESLRNAPDGSLRILTARGKFPQYYQYRRSQRQKYPHGRFIRKEEKDLAARLAQKQYDERVLEAVTTRLYNLDRLLKDCETDFSSYYSDLSVQRKKLVTPLILPDDEYVISWKESKHSADNPYPLPQTFLTENGEYVRSKSEKIIADKFFREGIPYFYEPALRLDDRTLVSPDFVLLNVRTRQEYYYEHFGMMDDPVYSSKAVRKINDYLKNDYLFGENLLYTFESRDEPFDIRTLNHLINIYLK